MGEVHVVPHEDLVLHEVAGDECPCGPDPLYDGGGVIYKHHSLDNREAGEV
jgi:hypothetical protein